MSEKVQLDHLLLDVDFLHKPTIVGFRRNFGWAAITWLIEIYCQMSRATDALVTRDVMLAIADDMRLDRCDEMIAHCLDYGLMFQADVFFSNTRVLKDQESLAKKRNQSKERQENYRNKRVSNALHNAPETRLPDTDTVTDTEDIKKKEVVPGKIQPGDLKILEFDQIQWEALSIQNDKTTLERAILLAESYIDKHKKKDPQRYRELCDEAKSGKSYLLSWPISEAMKQIKNEGAAQARLDKAKTPFQKPEEAPRAQPKVYEPPKVEAASPQAAAKFKQDLQGLIKTTAKAVSA